VRSWTFETLDVVADRGYYEGGNIKACENADITVTLPLPQSSGAKAEGRFGKQNFVEVCNVDQKGTVKHEAMIPSDPEEIADFVQAHAENVVRIGLESGPTSTWLWTELDKMGLPVICIDARHAKAALKMQINKSGRNDAVGRARRWLPRKTKLAEISHQKIRAIGEKHNITPRHCLGFRTPNEIFHSIALQP